METTETVLAMPAFRVVRIVSRGDRSPEGYWYDQDEHEWVMVITGEAELTVEGEGTRRLGPGESLLLPRRTRHRVERTSEAGPTEWLAVFFGGERIPELAPAAVARIVGHMNEDHADSLLDYARTFGGEPGAQEARMLEADATGFTLEASVPGGHRQLRLPFDPPVGDAGGARTTLVSMAHEARARLGGQGKEG